MPLTPNIGPDKDNSFRKHLEGKICFNRDGQDVQDKDQIAKPNRLDTTVLLLLFHPAYPVHPCKITFVSYDSTLRSAARNICSTSTRVRRANPAAVP
jgi:hypothetical protein